MTYYFNYTTQFTDEQLLSQLSKLYNETNDYAKTLLICRLTPCYSSKFYTILKIHNEVMAEHYLTNWYKYYQENTDKPKIDEQEQHVDNVITWSIMGIIIFIGIIITAIFGG